MESGEPSVPGMEDAPVIEGQAPATEPSAQDEEVAQPAEPTVTVEETPSTAGEESSTALEDASATEVPQDPVETPTETTHVEKPESAEAIVSSESPPAMEASDQTSGENTASNVESVGIACKLFVAPIPRSFTSEELRTIFEEVGPVVDCMTLRDKITGLSRGCAFVTFPSQKLAESAIKKFHRTMVIPQAEKPLEVQYARSKQGQATEGPPNHRQLFFRSSTAITEESTRSLFGQYGEIESLSLFKDSTEGNKGCGYITMKTRAAAQAAKDALDEKHKPEGSDEAITVKWQDDELQDRKRKRGRDDPPDGNNKQLFFGRAAKSADEKVVEALFSKYGKVQEVIVFREKAGGSKGCGFVSMSTREEAEAALTALDGKHKMDGMKDAMSIKWADQDMQHRKKLTPAGPRGPPAGPYGPPPPHGGYGGYGPPPHYGGYGGYGGYGPPPYGQYSHSYNYYDHYRHPYPPPHYDNYGHPYPPHGHYNQPYGPPSYGGHYGAPPPAGAAAPNENNKLYIGGVPHNITETDLQPLFARCGTISDLRVLRDKDTKIHRGAAFVTYATKEEADLAIATYHQNYTLPGNPRPVIVKYAAARNNQTQGSVGASAPASDPAHYPPQQGGWGQYHQWQGYDYQGYAQPGF